jgi:hypothetical protein
MIISDLLVVLVLSLVVYLDIIAIAITAIDTIYRWYMVSSRWIVQIVSLSTIAPVWVNDSQNTSLQIRNHCCIYKATGGLQRQSSFLKR